MKILNKTVSERFVSFYEVTVSQIGEPQFRPTQTPGRGECQFEGVTPVINLRTDLNGSRFEHHVAHELIHALQHKEAWPRLVSRYPYRSPINELGITLYSIVLDLNAEDRLKLWSFDSAWIIDEQYRNLKKAILDENVPATGSNRWRRAVMIYAYASLTQPARRWDGLNKVFAQRAPNIERKGDELSFILRKNGWNSPDESLASLIAIRDSIGLLDSQIGIIDGKTGRRL